MRAYLYRGPNELSIYSQSQQRSCVGWSTDEESAATWIL